MKPLHNARVLDLGIITAGASTSALLADMGAEVIKIESESYMDPFRMWLGDPPEDPKELPPFFRMTNRGKANLCLDLKSEQGRAVFLRLLRRCDIVVENFRRGVLEKLGLDFETLKTANPNVILASVSSQGETGPDAGYVSFGSTLEAMSGLAAITGYKGGPPVISGRDLNYPDQVVSIFAAGQIATAWYARQQGQKAVHLDISQRELTSFLSGDALMADAQRQGNAQTDMSEQECFRSSDDHWLAVSVPLGFDMSEITKGKSLTAWIAQHTAALALNALNQAGIPCTRVLDGKSVLGEMGESWSYALLDDENGKIMKGLVFEGVTRPDSVSRPAVPLGHDTHDVLSRVGKFSDDEIQTLVTEGVVSLQPTIESATAGSW